MKGLIILLLVLIAVSSVPLFASTTYDINFTTTTGLAPTSGSFTYDPIAGFSNFTVVWDGVTFDETAGANAVYGAAIPGCFPGTPATAFALMTQSLSGSGSCAVTGYDWVGNGFGSPPGVFYFVSSSSAGTLNVLDRSLDTSGNVGAGNWTLTAVSAPEPATFGSLLLGLVSLGLGYMLRSRTSAPPSKLI